MRFVFYAIASNTTAIVPATLLAVAIAMGGGLSFLPANNILAQMTGNMTGGTMCPDGMMGMGPGMMVGNQSAMMQMMEAFWNDGYGFWHDGSWHGNDGS